MLVTIDIDEKRAEFLSVSCTVQKPDGETKTTTCCIDNRNGDAEQTEIEEDDRKSAVRWHNTMYELPNVFQHVIVFMPEEKPHEAVTEGYFRPDGTWFAGGFNRDSSEVTHWTEKPDAPAVTEL